jgi:hypothetical protein
MIITPWLGIVKGLTKGLQNLHVFIHVWTFHLQKLVHCSVHSSITYNLVGEFILNQQKCNLLHQCYSINVKNRKQTNYNMAPNHH